MTMHCFETLCVTGPIVHFSGHVLMLLTMFIVNRHCWVIQKKTVWLFSTWTSSAPAAPPMLNVYIWERGWSLVLVRMWLFPLRFIFCQHTKTQCLLLKWNSWISEKSLCVCQYIIISMTCVRQNSSSLLIIYIHLPSSPPQVSVRSPSISVYFSESSTHSPTHLWMPFPPLPAIKPYSLIIQPVNPAAALLTHLTSRPTHTVWRLSNAAAEHSLLCTQG